MFADPQSPTFARCTASPQRPLPPPRKQWYDKLADAILGDEDTSASGASTRYALICQKCFAHNGLVKESMWEDARTYPDAIARHKRELTRFARAEYVCPKCGYFNPSARTLREIKEGKMPRSPETRSPPQGPSAANGIAAAPAGVSSQVKRDGSPAQATDQDEATSMDVDS